MFLPGESQGWGSLVGCHLWGRTESGPNWSDLATAVVGKWNRIKLWTPGSPNKTHSKYFKLHIYKITSVSIFILFWLWWKKVSFLDGCHTQEGYNISSDISRSKYRDQMMIFSFFFFSFFFFLRVQVNNNKKNKGFILWRTCLHQPVWSC